MSLELVAGTRGGLRSDPKQDEVRLAVLVVERPPESEEAGATHVFVLRSLAPAKLSQLRSELGRQAAAPRVHAAESEEALVKALVEVVRSEDPDVLVGWEIQRSSWGYLLERGLAKGWRLAQAISRVPDWEGGSEWSEEEQWWSMAQLKIAGRVVLNLWRIFRHEVSLTSYRRENVAFHLLHRRIPRLESGSLDELAGERRSVGRAARELASGAALNLELLRACDLVQRTTEMGRLYGIQLFEVLSRGSQFRVESMLLRLCGEQGMAAASPSPRLREQMAAPEWIALTMEPRSGFYTDPVVVLDFQSLYPSIVIAYNYCYSTCLGKVSQLPGPGEEFKLGCLGRALGREDLEGLRERDVRCSPAGVAFVKPSVRRGLMPIMLEEILETRLMVKRGLKGETGAGRAKLLDARQLALKLIANVTYGYTSANFSGRMPCVEVADSIVAKGRETLEAAMAQVAADPRWAPLSVVYGDTDSLFVHLPGRSRPEAFRIGREIAAAVTAHNPRPVKLKFEKVYQPCILQTKKRYVGYAYESEAQTEPKLDAKGIETVRRDSVPLTGKLLEKSLRLFFDGMGRERPVQRYLIHAFSRLLNGRTPLHDLVFAREFRGLEGYRPTAQVPALKLAREREARDGRSVPLMSERVSYVVGTGAPTATLFSCVREPWAVVGEGSGALHLDYYLRGVLVPPLERALGLAGLSVAELVRGLYRLRRTEEEGRGLRTAPSEPRQVLQGRLALAQRLCAACARVAAGEDVPCRALHCPVLHQTHTLAHRLTPAPHTPPTDPAEQIISCGGDRDILIL